MNTETCHYEVSRKGQAQPCDKPAIGFRMAEAEFADYPPYPVCQRHFNKAKQPPLPWRDVVFGRHNPATGEPLEPAHGHARPCRDHAHYFDAGMVVVSCAKCLHHSGTLADCLEHSEPRAA